MGQGNQYQFQGATPAPSTSKTGHIGQDQSVGRGRPQDLQAESSGQAGQMTCYHCRQPEVRVKGPAVVSERSFVGVRDPGRYPEFLCGCKRPGEISRISVPL